jgi:hypothetical protein
VGFAARPAAAPALCGLRSPGLRSPGLRWAPAAALVSPALPEPPEFLVVNLFSRSRIRRKPRKLTTRKENDYEILKRAWRRGR